MQDDAQKTDDDFEDFEDFEDFDDEEVDLEDVEDLDDEDLSEDDEFADDGEFDEESSDIVQSKASGNSFLTSKVGLATIAVVLLGGGGFAFMQMSGGGAPAQPMPAAMPAPDAAPVPQDLAQGDMPPMPSPTQAEESFSQDSAGVLDLPETSDSLDLGDLGEDLSLLEEPAVSDIDTDGTLTPMPDVQDEQFSGDLASLDLEEDLGVLEEDDAAFDLDLGLTPEEDSSDLGGADLAMPEQVAEPVLEEPMEVLDIDAQDADLEKMEDPDLAVNMQEDVVSMEAPSPEIDLMRDENEKLALESEAKTQEIADARGKIEGLEATVSDLKNKISELEARLEEANSAPQAVEQEVSVEETVPSVSPSEKSPVKVSTETRKPAVQSKPAEWILRAAQPGRASIADKSTGDIRNVEVGDTVPGLGRIQSIEIDGGRWVVRGTLKSVYQ